VAFLQENIKVLKNEGNPDTTKFLKAIQYNYNFTSLKYEVKKREGFVEAGISFRFLENLETQINLLISK
jgi:hypothetical protein